MRATSEKSTSISPTLPDSTETPRRNRAFTRFWHSSAVREFRHLCSARRWHRFATAHQRKLPDFIIAGAQKSGTTSLFAYLCEHPLVTPPLTKEMSFFDNQFHRGLRWYRSHFPRDPQFGTDSQIQTPTLTGESTAYYLFHPHAAARISKILPGVKLIILLRNPVDRAYSHYQLNLRRGNETLSFEGAIAAEKERLKGEGERMRRDESYASFAHEKHSYLARGRYAEQLAVWRQYFGPDQLLLIESSQFFSNTAAEFDRVQDFLGLPGWQPKKFGNRFPGKYFQKMSRPMRELLTDYFIPHNERLYQMLGQRFQWDTPTAVAAAK
jgi:hypothetical protein